MSAWWFGVNNSRESRADGAAGHMHFCDVVPLLRDDARITWPFDGAPGSMKVYGEMAAGDGVILWMGDGVEAAWGVLGLATIDAIDHRAQQLSLRRSDGPWTPLTPYEAGEPGRTPVAQTLLRIFGETYGPLRSVSGKRATAANDAPPSAQRAPSSLLNVQKVRGRRLPVRATAHLGGLLRLATPFSPTHSYGSCRSSSGSPA